MNSDLTFKTHVKKKGVTAMLNLQSIKNIRKYHTTESHAKLVVSLCMSHLDYSNSILTGLPDCTIHQVQSLQNYGAKLVVVKNIYDSNMQSLATLHWLPIRSRIKFKILTLVFRCLRGHAPDYLKNFLLRCPETSQTLISSNIEDCLVIPRTVRKTSAVRLFSEVGSTLWNNLPNFNKDSNNIDEFKRKLKTFLFVNKDF